MADPTTAAQAAAYPVRIFTAARIVTLNDRTQPQHVRPDAADVVRAIAVQGERIVATGSLDQLRAQFDGVEVTDFGDSTLIPGLNDAHMHPSQVAEDALHLDLSPEVVPDRQSLIDVLRKQADDTPAGEWVRGTRYDHGKTTGGEIIDRAFLDEVVPDHPCLVSHIAGHWGVVNTVGLERTGFTDESDDPVGGFLGRDAAGHLNGVLYESAHFLVGVPALAPGGETLVPAHSIDDQLRGLRIMLDRFHAAGLTSVNDALAYPGAVRLFQEAERRGELSMRIGMLVAYPHFEQLAATGISHGFGSTKLRYNGVKGFVDGAVGGGTCLLEQPYDNNPNDFGQQVISDAELLDMVRHVHSTGTRIGVHANGDAAVRKVVEAFKTVDAENHIDGMRHRIEHCSMVDDEILSDMATLGAIAAPFGPYVSFHGHVLEGWYGDRLSRMFTHRSFLDAGVGVAGTSDFMCGPYQPLYGIQSCVTRAADSDGAVLGGEQRVSPYEALWIYTVGSADSTGEAGSKGRLAPGYLADFVELAENPLTCGETRIADIDVRSTWVGGECVFAAAGR